MSKNRILRRLRFPLATLVAAAATAAIAGPTATESDFGNSVRHMIEQQTYDPRAAAQPAENPPTALDGERAAVVIKAYRTETDKSVKPDPPIYLREVR